jgi:hypothetical protein
MNDPGVASWMRSLWSDDLETRITSVEALAHSASTISGEVVSLLVREDEGRYLVFERLSGFGSLIIGPLEDALENSSGEARFLISAALVVLGSPLGTEDVLRAVRAGDPDLHLAVKVLTKDRNTAAGSLIEQALRDADLDNFDELNSLTQGLRALSRAMPEDIRHRLAAVEPAWRRDSLLSE